MKDLWGKAILSYAIEGQAEDLVTCTSLSGIERLSVGYLFRQYDEMPPIEKCALDLCYGKVLDVGCGAGAHSLYLQKKTNCQIYPIDISDGAVKACLHRGLPASKRDVFYCTEKEFNTVLLLMNGSGIAGTLPRLADLLNHLRQLLTADGQILIDSSDISYLFKKKQRKTLQTRIPYYGEVDYYLAYANEKEIPFKWLYVDFYTLQNLAARCGLKATLVMTGQHFDYLAKLQKK